MSHGFQIFRLGKFKIWNLKLFSSHLSIKIINSSPQEGLYIVFNIRNGSITTAPINLNTSEIVNPAIRNGRRMSHTNGKRMSITSATGQQTTRRMHHKTSPINVFIVRVLGVRLLTVRRVQSGETP